MIVVMVGIREVTVVGDRGVVFIVAICVVVGIVVVVVSVADTSGNGPGVTGATEDDRKKRLELGEGSGLRSEKVSEGSPPGGSSGRGSPPLGGTPIDENSSSSFIEERNDHANGGGGKSAKTTRGRGTHSHTRGHPYTRIHTAIQR